MLAYHSDPALKSAIMSELAKHALADSFAKGFYWENGRGCAVGCALESIRIAKGIKKIDHSSHAVAADETGIPLILWRLDDRLFEGLPNGKAKAWPERFMGAIKPGADLTMIWPRFALWLLTEELPQRDKGNTKVIAAIGDVADLYREWCESGKSPEPKRWEKVRRSAYAAYAAYDAACAACAAYAAAAYDAAYAACAAYAADAADAAACAVYAADAADARNDCYIRMSDKLIELLDAS